ncbi:hypothetical protein Pelo_16507 [Pelomyxa schiedti]|nr:hypothetical protein Pelo_16507 [Pelomyxa schiedti]
MANVLRVVVCAVVVMGLLCSEAQADLVDKIAYGVFKTPPPCRIHDLSPRLLKAVQRFGSEIKYFKPTIIEVSGLTVAAMFYDDEGIELKTIQMDTFDVGDMIYTYTSHGFVYCPPGVVDCPEPIHVSPRWNDLPEEANEPAAEEATDDKHEL